MILKICYIIIYVEAKCRKNVNMKIFFAVITVVLLELS